MAWIEDTSRRTQKAKFYTDAAVPGKERCLLSIDDLHYHDGTAWQDVDESLVDDGADGFAKKCDKTRHIFRVGNGGTRRWYPRRGIPTEYVNITGIQYWRTTGGGSWRPLTLPAAVWKSQGAEWDMTNLYASITNTWNRIKADFILKNSSAYTRLRFAVEFVGLTYNPTTGELTSTTDGLVWGYISKPTAHYGTFPNQVDVPVTQTYDGTYIEWGVNTTGATFPIYVDPTFTDGNGGDTTTAVDTCILSDVTTWNNGTRQAAWMQPTRKALERYILSGISATATCGTGADAPKLYHYLTADGADNQTCTVYLIASANGDWIEGTKNQDTGGATEPTWAYKQHGNTVAWAGSAGLSTSGTDYDASSIGSFAIETADSVGHEMITDLTASVVEAWFGEATNPGILIVGSQAGSNDEIGLSDNVTAGYRPKLVVVYTEAGGGTAVPVFMHHYQFNMDR